MIGITSMNDELRDYRASLIENLSGARRQSLSSGPCAAAVNPALRSGAALRILLVEDDGLIRLTTAAMLTNLGHRLLEAGDGDAALSVLGDAEIDILVTDVNLPGFSGVELARRILVLQPDARVIFATGMGRSALDASLSTHATLMAKPYGALELRRALETVMRA